MIRRIVPSASGVTVYGFSCALDHRDDLRIRVFRQNASAIERQRSRVVLAASRDSPDELSAVGEF